MKQSAGRLINQNPVNPSAISNKPPALPVIYTSRNHKKPRRDGRGGVWKILACYAIYQVFMTVELVGFTPFLTSQPGLVTATRRPLKVTSLLSAVLNSNTSS